jgi:ATP-dependent DNA helicase PIF1
MNSQQKKAYEIAIKGKNIFLTGAAGTGKSYVLKQIITNLKKTKNVAVTASTGTAAYIINGITVHSWLKLGLAEEPINKLLEKLDKSHVSKKNIRKTQVLIIDEISMVSGEFFIKLDSCCKLARNSEMPFGGIQVVLCGDFAQLPPVSKGNHIDYCFKTSVWATSDLTTIYLTEIMRQRDDTRFIKLLTNLRHGTLQDTDRQLLFSCIDKEFTDEHSIFPTRLVPTNNHAKIVNDTHFRRLHTELYTFKMHVSMYIVNGKTKTQLKYIIQSLFSQYTSCMVHDDILNLKIGTRVILTTNLNVEDGLYNGAQGIVTKFISWESLHSSPHSTYSIAKRQFQFTLKHPEQYNIDVYQQGSLKTTVPIVKFLDREYAIFPVTTTIQSDTSDSPDVLFMIDHIPLKHAWALTIHKSQGMTLDRAQIDAGRYVFSSGQTYTALSRVRSIDSLSLIDFEPSKIKVDPDVVDFYDSLIDV